MEKWPTQEDRLEMAKQFFPEYWSKEKIEWYNNMVKKKAADMIAKGLKPHWTDFWGS